MGRKGNVIITSLIQILRRLNFAKAMQLTCVAFSFAILLFSANVLAQDEESKNAGSTTPVVIELFTAQSCVFCRDADEILDSLNNIQNVVVLSCHVDYYPADSDPLARSFCTDRQKTYLKAKDIAHIYTPHFVINGQEFSAAQRSELEKHVQKRLDEVSNIPQRLKITEINAPTYGLSLPDMTASIDEDTPATVYLFGGAQPVEVSKSGSPFEMKNAVTEYGVVTKWDGEPKELQFDLIKKEGLERVLIIVQSANLKILAAGEKSLIEEEPALDNPFEELSEGEGTIDGEAVRSEGTPLPKAGK